MRCEYCGGNVRNDTGRCLQCAREAKTMETTTEKSTTKSVSHEGSQEKSCKRCQLGYPATEEYFSKDLAKPDGLNI